MTKRRYIPKSVAHPEGPERKPSLFEEIKRPSGPRSHRFQRFYPGVEPAANNAPVPAQAATSDAFVHSPPDQTNTTPEENPDTSPDQALQEAFEQAAKEGFAAGIAQAQEQTQSKIDAHMRQMEAMLVQVRDMRQAHFEAFQHQCLEIALAGAEALSRRSFHTDTTTIKALIFEAVQELCGDSSIALHVSPQHAPELRTWVQEHFVDEQVQVVADPAFGPEDFRASSKAGSVTGNFSERLQILRDAVFAHKGRLDPSPEEFES